MASTSDIKFTPELFISAPRRSPAFPNRWGTHLMYTESAYHLDAHSATTEIKIFSVSSRESTLFSDSGDVKSPQWLTSTLVLWQKPLDDGTTQLWIGNANGPKNPYLAGTIKASISDVKFQPLEETTRKEEGPIALAFIALADSDGELLNSKDIKKATSSAREFETVKIRYWDNFLTAERSKLWYTVLNLSPDSGRYQLQDDPPVNALKGTHIDLPWADGPFGENGSYDISREGLLITALNPEKDTAQEISMDVYYLKLKTFTELPTPFYRIDVPGWEGPGSSSSAIFVSDGLAAVFLRSDNSLRIGGRLFKAGLPTGIKSIEDELTVREFSIFTDISQKEVWDRTPGELYCAPDNYLYTVAEDCGRSRLFQLKKVAGETQSNDVNIIAVPLTETESVSAICALNQDKTQGDHRLLITSSSMTTSSTFTIINPIECNPHYNTTLASYTPFALSPDLVSEFTFQGAKSPIHTFLINPPNFDETSTYPLAFLIHGGPQSAWSNAWSTRWNPALIAAQGYVVCMPNPTGSTGFGTAFARAVQGEWGGDCYTDLVACFAHLENKDKFPYIDTTRAVALGGSFGGYMANWIAGQPFAQKFRTLVSHDGIFSLPNLLSCDVSTETKFDLSVPIWAPPKISHDAWVKYDPSRFTHNWSTPMLVIHSELDYRCPITEGLATFNVCKQKGLEARFLSFSDEGHWVLQRENSLHWYRTVLGWINKFAGVEGEVLRPAVSEPVGRRW